MKYPDLKQAPQDQLWGKNELENKRISPWPMFLNS